MSLARLLRLHIDLRDEAAAAEVTPEALAAYAARTGWTHERDFGPWRIWRSGEQQVLFPAAQTWADYGQRVIEAIQRLAEHEGRSQLAVWADLVGITAPPVGLFPDLIDEPKRHATVHGWGMVKHEAIPHPLRPSETLQAVVQTCRHCGARRRRANTGVRLGARDTYQQAGETTWGDVLPVCVPKG